MHQLNNRQDYTGGRSAIYAENGVAATSHPVATQAALDILRAGGNAVDAGIAAISTLCVVEPAMTGLGGDCFMILCKGGVGKPIGLNSSGRAPAAATLEWYKEAGISEIEVPTAHAVTVPGAVDGWCRIHADHGKLDMAQILAPAIKAAEEGYIVQPRVARDWGECVSKLARDADSTARYLFDGKAPKVGDRVKLPELAKTLREIAAKGRDGFYKGWVAEDIVAKLTSVGGLHTLEDFEASEPTYVEPISTTYRGHQVYEIPPNGQGVTAQVILNVLEGYDYASLSELDRVHILAEAAKHAYARRDALIGDPDFGPVPVERLLSKDEADFIRSKIDMTRAAPQGEPDRFVHRDTTYMTVVDKDRNALSFINSLFSGFGSGITAPKSGVVLQNRGSSFRLIEGHPNAIAPRKRPMHTIIPGMLGQGDKMVMPFGVMGGQYQPVGHAALISNILDLGLDPQEAIAAPRSFAYNGEMLLEDTFKPEIWEGLRARGHDVKSQFPVGGGQAIWIDHERGLLIGGSEPRKDGCAMGC